MNDKSNLLVINAYALSCLADLLLLYSGHLDTLLGHLKKNSDVGA